MDQFVREVIASPLIWNCLTSKHPAYEHEQEVRLVVMGTPATISPFVTTRFRGSEIVPYIAQPMALRLEHKIAEIVVGPAAPPDSERTVRTDAPLHRHRLGLPHQPIRHSLSGVITRPGKREDAP